ncbi:MAG: hypothetical protein ABSA65_18820 [Acidimicrobiales bacterium]
MGVQVQLDPHVGQPQPAQRIDILGTKSPLMRCTAQSEGRELTERLVTDVDVRARNVCGYPTLMTVTILDRPYIQFDSLGYRAPL